MTKALTEILTSGSESFRRANQHLVAGLVLPVDPYQAKGDPYAIAPERKEGAKRRLRQKSGDGMNKWEREFLDYLKAADPLAYIYREVSLPIANGCRFKVDFLAAHTIDLNGVAVVKAYEVKGHARDDAIVKLKVAAHTYPWIAFRLVTKRRKIDGGGWSIEEVLK